MDKSFENFNKETPEESSMEELQKYINKEWNKMTPEEREEFKKKREQVEKTRRPEPQI